MHFRITPHAGHGAPEDALEMLWQRLDGNHESVVFAKEGPQIVARIEDDVPVAMTSDERNAIGRGLVLGVVDEVCEGSPELSSDWYAVSSAL